MTKPVRIIQLSNPGSGSTVLSNLLMAFFQPYESLVFMGFHHYNQDIVNNNIIIKTHDVLIDEWIKRFSDKYDLYFIISDRHDYDWNEHKKNKKILFINYEEILESKINPLPKISLNIYNKVNNFLPKEFMIYNRRNISIQNGINRINNMNKRYLEIKNKPFEFVDKYYQLHGKHRNRHK